MKKTYLLKVTAKAEDPEAAFDQIMDAMVEAVSELPYEVEILAAHKVD